MKYISKRLFSFILAAALLLSGYLPQQAQAQELWLTGDYSQAILSYYADYEYEAMLMADGTVRAQSDEPALAAELNTWQNVSKLRCAYGYVAALDWYGNVLSYGFEEHVARELSSWEGLYDIYIGTGFVLGLGLDGTVRYCCYYPGDESFYGLSEINYWPLIEQISLKESFGVAVSEYGDIFTLGEAGYTNQPGFDPENIHDALLVWSNEWICFCLHQDDRISFWGIDEHIYDAGLIAREGIRTILPGDTSSVGLRWDGSLIFLGRCMDEAFRSRVDACRDVSAAFYSCGYGNNGVYVVHNDGRPEVILREDADVGQQLKPIVESWTDVSQLYADSRYVCGQRDDGTLRVATVYPDSLVNYLGDYHVQGSDGFNYYEDPAEQYDYAYSDGMIYYMPPSQYDTGSGVWGTPDSGSYVSSPTGFIDFYKCYGYLAALRDDGTVAAYDDSGAYIVSGGDNRLEELLYWRDVQQLEGFSHMLAGITYDGRVLTYNFPEDLAAQISQWRDIRQIFYWNDFAIGLKADGSMVLAKDEGESFFDYLDLEEVLTWKNVAYMSGMTCPMRPSLVALGYDGRVYSLDSEHYEEMVSSGYEDGCCLNEEIYDGVAVSSNGYINHCVRSDGTLVSWGPDAYLDPAKLAEGGYVYAVGYVGLKADGSLRYLRVEDPSWEKSELQIAVENCRGVKNIVSGGESYYAVKQDGTVDVLKTCYYIDESEELQEIMAVESWQYVDTLEAGSAYVFMRDISASITVYPELPPDLR